MKPLLRLALAADLVALMTVVLGSWTRINGAGLTCPDWPLCHGRLVPSLTDGTLWEWTHRLLASIVAPLLIALIAVAWSKRRRSPFIGPTLAVIAVLFVVQIFLGAETVRLANAPTSVVLHWATAMALIAALSAMAVFAAACDATPQAREATRASALQGLVLGLTATLAFVTMCIRRDDGPRRPGVEVLADPLSGGGDGIRRPEQRAHRSQRIPGPQTRS